MGGKSGEEVRKAQAAKRALLLTQQREAEERAAQMGAEADEVGKENKVDTDAVVERQAPCDDDLQGAAPLDAVEDGAEEEPLPKDDTAMDKAAEEDAKRKAAEEEALRKAAEEEDARIKAEEDEEEARKKAAKRDLLLKQQREAE